MVNVNRPATVIDLLHYKGNELTKVAKILSEIEPLNNEQSTQLFEIKTNLLEVLEWIQKESCKVLDIS